MINERLLTCVECPRGCQITVKTEDGKVIEVTGNTCPKGKAYAENEVTAPRRVVTSTVKSDKGIMIPVKTSKPVLKANMFEIIKKINTVTVTLPIKLGDVVLKDIEDGIDLVATKSAE